jgi:SH3-like domain-containing protein
MRSPLEVQGRARLIGAMRLIRFILPLCLLTMLGVPASAQDREVPYWASIRADEINMRVGPSETYPIAWVYHRPGLPLKVLRIKEGWRLVEDPDGASGWMVARFLSPDRTAIVVGSGVADMRDEPGDGAKLLWRVEPGVVGKLSSCNDGWCRFDAAGRVGWIRQARLWGAGEP